MSKEQEALLHREDRIAECFQAVVLLQSESPEERRKANVEGLMNFLASEYSATRALASGAKH